MTVYVITRNGERTKIESTLIQSLWRLAATWNRESGHDFRIEARG
jgi:hypothetical protein